MKGPYERVKYRFRRVWECPKCHARKRTDGDITALVCVCQLALAPAERVSMKLIEDGCRRVKVNS